VKLTTLLHPSAEIKNGGPIPPLPNTSSWRVYPFFNFYDISGFTYESHTIMAMGGGRQPEHLLQPPELKKKKQKQNLYKKELYQILTPKIKIICLCGVIRVST
jgi:hypothetical protein